MQSSTKKNNTLKKYVNVTIAGNLIEDLVYKKITNIAKQVSINGYRKGKVSLNIMNKNYSGIVRNNVLKNIMQNFFIDKITKEKINLIKIPKYIPNKYKVGQDFKFSVEFEIYPEIQVKGLDNLIIEKPIVKIKDGNINSILQNLRKQEKNWQATLEKIKIGDRVTIDFIGNIADRDFKKHKIKNFKIIIGQNNIISDFESHFISHKVNDQFIFTTNLPDNFFIRDFRSKIVYFNIKITKVEKFLILELDKNFITDKLDNKKINIYHQTKKYINIKIKKIIFDIMKFQIIKTLITANDIYLPDFLISIETNILKKNLLNNNKKNEKISNKISEFLIQQAKYYVKIGLLLDSIIKKYKLKVNDKQIIKTINTMYYKNKLHKNLTQITENKELLNNICNKILEEQAMEIIIKNSEIIRKEMNFEDLINQKEIFKINIDFIKNYLK